MFPPFATETLSSGYKKESVVLADTGDQTASQLCFLPSLCKTRNDSFTTRAAADARMSGAKLGHFSESSRLQQTGWRKWGERSEGHGGIPQIRWTRLNVGNMDVREYVKQGRDDIINEDKSGETNWECLTLFWSSGTETPGTRVEFIIKRMDPSGGTDKQPVFTFTGQKWTLPKQFENIERKKWIVCMSLNGHDKWIELQ